MQQETAFGRRVGGRPANPPAYQAYGVIPGPQPGLILTQPPLVNPEVARNEETKEKYFGPGPGPCMIPETIINLDFNEVFTENDSTKAYKYIHIIQEMLYKYSKWLLYNFLGIVCGIPFSVIYGLSAAGLMFVMVWIIYPIFKALSIIIWPALKAVYIILHVLFMLPFAEAMGRCVRHFQINVRMNSYTRNMERNEQQAEQGGHTD